jgi:hypothetical protein
VERISAILATTHVDRHNEAIALSALEDMVRLVRSAYLPMWNNHDPRLPPLGRVVAAEVRELADGEHAVEAEIELFEEGDEVPIEPNGRRAVVAVQDSDRPTIGWDRAFAGSEDQAVVHEICTILGAEPQEQGKKALEPIAVLTIALTVAASNIAGGFLQKLGADAWDAAKSKLKSLFARRRAAPAQLLCVAVTVELMGELRLVEVILSEPVESDIDSLSAEVIERAIELARAATIRNPHLLRFVFSYSHADGLVVAFAVASNGVPLTFLPDNQLHLGDDDRDA